MSKQPYQVININPLPPDPTPRGPSCIEAAVALAVASGSLLPGLRLLDNCPRARVTDRTPKGRDALGAARVEAA